MVEINSAWDYFIYMADSFSEHGEHSSAIENYIKAREINPDEMNVHFKLGMEYVAAKSFEEAKICFEKRIEFGGNLTGAYINLGLCYSELGEHHLAIRYLVTSSHYDKDCETINEICFNIGLEYVKLSNYVESAKYFKTAISMNTRDFMAYKWLAECYRKLGRLDKSISTLEKVIKLDPDHSGALIDLASTEAEYNQNFDAAIPLLERAMVADPTDSASYYNLAVIHFWNFNYGLALDVFKKAVDIDPDLTRGFFENNLIFDLMVDIEKFKEMMKLAASKGEKNAAKWLRENTQYIKLHDKESKKSRPDEQLSMHLNNDLLNREVGNLELVLLNNT